MTPYRIKKHRQRGHHGSHMALVPFIDMLTMLVVFLLLHSSDAEILPNTKNIQIPQSVADLKPHETVTIMVTRDELLVNGRITEVARARFWVEFEIVRPSDNLLLISCRQALALVQMPQGRPLRLPEGFPESFALTG